MSWLGEVLNHKDSLIRGATLILGGMALILAGTLVGLGGSKAAQLGAGTLAVGGVVTMFLAFFVYIVPPMLPAR